MRNSSDPMLPIYGAICGDIIGSRLEMVGEPLLHISGYPLFTDECKPTDDTVFTIAITECLLRGESAPEQIVHTMQRWGRRYPDAGFGYSTQAWIKSDDPHPYGSDRNGAAMRVSPCGVFADTIDEALDLARLTAEVSHNTHDGVAGAQAIAAAVFMARNGASKDEIRAYVTDTFGYDLTPTVEGMRADYHGFSCRAADTVPQAIICFLESTDVESAIRMAISLGSDADTLASMAAAIAAPYYGEIPFLDTAMSYLPADMREVLDAAADR